MKKNVPRLDQRVGWLVLDAALAVARHAALHANVAVLTPAGTPAVLHLSRSSLRRRLDQDAFYRSVDFTRRSEERHKQPSGIVVFPSMFLSPKYIILVYTIMYKYRQL